MDITSQFQEIEKIISKLNIEEINWIRYSKNIIRIKSFEQFQLIEFSKLIGISYKYSSNKIFILIIFSGEFTYILSDQDKMNSEDIIKALDHLSNISDIIFVWNIKHLAKVYTININSKFIDVQILVNIILQKKDGIIEFQSNYHDQVSVFINSVYKNDSYYYYIPRNILSKSMMYESISALILGKLLLSLCNKLKMNDLNKRLLNLSIVLSDIEKNSIKINIKITKKLIKSGLIFKKQYVNLIKYCSEIKTNQFPIEYRHLRSKTGRIIFDNKSGVSILSLPDNECRKIIVPEFNKFLSMDIKAAEIFYIIKANSNFLNNVEINDSFDVYDYILKYAKIDKKRDEIKNTIIKWFYGFHNFTNSEMEIKSLIEEKIPEIVPDQNVYVPIYIQTRFGRIIKVDKSITKLLNNIPQSEFGDVMIDILIYIWSEIKKNDFRTKIKFIVYDQIIFDCPNDEIKEVENIIKLCTDSKLPYRVTIADNWFEVSKK